MRIAVLDDYQNVALSFADWSELKAEITVFNDHVVGDAALVARLEPFDIVCVMRERTPLPRAVLEKLPNLKLIASTGRRNASLDGEAAKELGIDIVNTGGDSTSTVELTWALILASARGLVNEVNSVRGGGWQIGVGNGLRGKTLGLLGLGNIGSAVAKVGQAFGMQTIAWSHNLTDERAQAVGVERVEKEALFARADVLSVHLVLGERSCGLVDGRVLKLMKPTARLVNTSRGPIVVERDLLEAVEAGTIAGAAVDVFDVEPLPEGHAFRTMRNVLASPHIGYVSQESYRRFYEETVRAIGEWMERRG